MKRKAIHILPWLMLLFLAACGAGSVTLSAVSRSVATKTETISPTETKTAPPTITPTATEIPTAVPMVTPSPGPAPDLEIRNYSMNKDTFIAEMVNNSDRPMIFPGNEYGIRMDYEEWADAFSMGYRHLLRSIFIKPNVTEMNCILYPGEVGLISANISNICGDSGDINDCEIKLDEYLPAPPLQLGDQLVGYQGIYRRWEELKKLYPFTIDNYPAEMDKRYHPPAENLTYFIQGSEIIITFDMEIYLPSYIGLPLEPSWIILYDADGRIINVLYTDLYFEKVNAQYLESGIYHFYGVGGDTGTRIWETPNVHTQWWKPIVSLTSDDLLRVDHIRVLNEIADVNMCYNPIHWKSK